MADCVQFTQGRVSDRSCGHHIIKAPNLQTACSETLIIIYNGGFKKLEWVDFFFFFTIRVDV